MSEAKSQYLVIPETCPRRLRSIIKRLDGKNHAIAEALQVNVRYIHEYLAHGKEPVNPQIRAKMFLPKRRRKNDGRSGFAELPQHIQWWRKLRKDDRDAWIKLMHIANQ